MKKSLLVLVILTLVAASALPALAAGRKPVAKAEVSGLIAKLDEIKSVYYQWRIATGVYNTPALHAKIGKKLMSGDDKKMDSSQKRFLHDYIRSLRPQTDEEVNAYFSTQLPTTIKSLFERLANNFALKLENLNGELALEIFQTIDKGDDAKLAEMIAYLKAVQGMDGTSYTGSLFVMDAKLKFEAAGAKDEAARKRLAALGAEIGLLHKNFAKIDTYAFDHAVVNKVAQMTDKDLWKWISEAILVETADTPSRLEWQHMVELNKATVQDLMNIPGVSAKAAQAIVDYRAKNTQFTSINELNNVKGIGLKTLRVIKTCAYVSEFRYPVKDTTVLCFFNGDNNLELSSMLGINTFEKIGTTDNLNIVVEVDRIGQEASGEEKEGDSWLDGNWTTSRRYLITKDDVPFKLGSVLMEKMGEVDMGDEATLLNFINWGVSHFPAKKYVLIICNHGSEFGIGGISFDDQSQNHFDTLELGQALAKSAAIFQKSTGDAKFASIIFDCCLLAKIEVMAEIRDVAHAAFACENVQTTWYDYDKFFKFATENPKATGQELANAFSTAYVNSMKGSDTVLTATAFDLDRFDVFYTPFRDFAKELRAFLDRAPEKAAAALAKMTPIKETTVCDLLTFAKFVAQAAGDDAGMKAAADALIEAWGAPKNVETEFVPQVYPDGKFVIAEADNKEEPTANGLTAQFNDIYTWRAIAKGHSQGKVMTDEWIDMWTHKKFQGGSYAKLRLAQETEWDEFLVKAADLKAPPRKKAAKKAEAAK